MQAFVGSNLEFSLGTLSYQTGSGSSDDSNISTIVPAVVVSVVVLLAVLTMVVGVYFHWYRRLYHVMCMWVWHYCVCYTYIIMCSLNHVYHACVMLQRQAGGATTTDTSRLALHLTWIFVTAEPSMNAQWTFSSPTVSLSPVYQNPAFKQQLPQKLVIPSNQLQLMESIGEGQYNIMLQ